MRSGESRNPPSPTLHPWHSNARTFPVLWQWSICALLPPLRIPVMRMLSLHMAHASPCSRQRDSIAFMGWFGSLSLKGRSLFHCAKYALAQARHLVSIPSLRRLHGGNSLSGFLFEQARHSLPAGVFNSSRREGCSFFHFSYQRCAASFAAIGLRRVHSFICRFRQMRHLCDNPSPLLMRRPNSENGFSWWQPRQYLCPGVMARM